LPVRFRPRLLSTRLRGPVATTPPSHGGNDGSSPSGVTLRSAGVTAARLRGKEEVRVRPPGGPLMNGDACPLGRELALQASCEGSIPSVSTDSGCWSNGTTPPSRGGNRGSSPRRSIVRGALCGVPQKLRPGNTSAFAPPCGNLAFRGRSGCSGQPGLYKMPRSSTRRQNGGLRRCVDGSTIICPSPGWSRSTEERSSGSVRIARTCSVNCGNWWQSCATRRFRWS
jgi:hypothetical protein